MFLLEYVENLYEQSQQGSADFIISEYLLMNAENLPEISLTQIARDTKLPKSTVSDYFCAYGIPGGYVAFKRAVSSQLGIAAISIEKHMEWIHEIMQRSEQVRSYSTASVKKLSDLIISSQSVLFIGPYRYRECFLNAIALCRKLNIRARYMVMADMARNKTELENLISDNDLAVFLYPDTTYTEFTFRLYGTIQLAEAFRKCRGRKHYICRQGKGDRAREDLTFVRLKQNPYDYYTAVYTMGMELFTECVIRSGIDQKTSIFII